MFCKKIFKNEHCNIKDGNIRFITKYDLHLVPKIIQEANAVISKLNLNCECTFIPIV